MSLSVRGWLLAIFTLVLPTGALANADHLLITEVGYDVALSPENSEWFEIHNPTDSDIVLNDGTAAYYVTDDEDVYWNVVNGTVTNSSSDWTLTFPVGTVLPARSFAVVVKDDLAWVSEFFPAGQAAFEGQPGEPLLFEFSIDADSVPNMVNVGTGTAMSLTNSGEDLVLFYWDGASDLVQDVDHVCWEDLTELIDKTGVALDGPDADGTNSTFLPDAGTATAAPAASQGVTIQRIHALELGEVTSGGNGITGNDESTEDWSSSFVVGVATPGRFLIQTDGDLSDLAAASAALAVSTADGPATGATADYGEDGTLTELYAVPEDTDGDGLADILHVGVRGAFFSTSAGQNGTFVGLDVDPGSGNGITALLGVGVSGSDTTGTLDNDITLGGIDFDTALTNQGIGFDAVLGWTDGSCGTSDVCGARGFGTDGVAGTFGDYAFLADFTTLSDLAVGICAAELPGAPGTVYAGPDGLEFAVPLADLGLPSEVALAAWTSGDGPVDPSPNTLPENSNNTFGSLELLESVVCVGIDAPLPLAYTDSDGDGEGDPATATPYCGTAPSGLVLNGDDCDDTDISLNSGATEVCDGDDEDCDGEVDEGFDGDSDGAFDGNDAGCLGVYGAAAVDCDDADAAIFPGAAELCDGVDNDCGGDIDEDFDGDSDGAFTNSVNECITTYGPTSVDCNDSDPAVYPNASEVCDGDDENCNGVADDGFDTDGDGAFDALDAGCLSFYGVAADCDDTNSAVNPTAAEACANLVDDDCDGLVDIADPDCALGDDDDSAAGDDDDSAAGDDDDATGDDDDDATGDDDDDSAAGDDDDATGDDDDATGDDDDATGDDDDATGDDDDVTSDDDDITVGDDDDDGGCSCSTGGDPALDPLWALLLPAFGAALRRRPRSRR